MFWLLVALGILVLIEIALFAILIIRGRGKEEPEPRKLVGLTLDTSLVKREYELGEQFDVAGLIATVNYSDEPFEEIIDEFTIATPELLEELERDGKKPEEGDIFKVDTEVYEIYDVHHHLENHVLYLDAHLRPIE